MNGSPGRWPAAVLLAAVLACDGSGIAEPEPALAVAIGGLLPLTGAFGSAGLGSQAAMILARDEINAQLAAAGSALRFETDIEDTESTPAVARQRIETLHGRSVRLVIGPQTSSAVEAVRAFADEAGVLVVSPSSTAVELSIAGDNIFRFSPDDSHEAAAVAALVAADGIDTLVPVFRDDIAGRGLTELVRASFTALGGMVAEGVAYDPASPGAAATASALRAQVEVATGVHGAERVAVYVVAFEELLSILDSAREVETLAGVRWYANNVSFLFGPLLSEPATRVFLESTEFASAAYVGDPAAAEEAARVTAHLEAELGHQVDGYSIVSYDAFWIAARAFTTTGPEPSTAALKTALVEAAHRHFGATGWMTLNEAGDRRYGHYDFFGVCPGTGEWVVTARYRASPPAGARTERVGCP